MMVLENLLIEKIEYLFEMNLSKAFTYIGFFHDSSDMLFSCLSEHVLRFKRTHLLLKLIHLLLTIFLTK